MDHEDMAVFGLAEIKRLACTGGHMAATRFPYS
jgi:hypothetical protein